MTGNTDDAFVFVDEPVAEPARAAVAGWRVLVVDDEPDVHAATRLALKDLSVDGRPLVLSHAYSVEEARELLQRDDFAVALVDVVMGADDAGLRLVRYIRRDLGNQAIRIILRTGQPGYAPEIDTIRAYDINDYKTKSELTQVRLFTSLMMALRSYAQFCRIHELAYRDEVVDLPNLNALLQAIDRHEPCRDTVALLDIDGFADIDSVFDDNYCEAVLRTVAARLRDAFPPDVLVTRISGDLFGLYGNAGELAAQRLTQVFASPLHIAPNGALRLSATTGLVHLADHDRAATAVLKDASAALRQAKRFQRGKCLYFEPAQADAARGRIAMLNQLRASFSEGHLSLRYQPFIRLADRKVTGAEGLLRWQTHEQQFIGPDQFVPLAEQSGLMIPIGKWITRTALRWRRRLAGRVDDDFRVAINVSHVQFAEPDFADWFLAMLDETGVPGFQVEIELTESVAINDFELLTAHLCALRRRGVHVAMDDFGTGYSSLSVIQGLHLKLDRVKIDRGFVNGDDQTFEIARTIIALSSHLGMATIAEGIETEAQCMALQRMGCEEGQGYLFSHPLDESAFSDWLAAQRA